MNDSELRSLYFNTTGRASACNSHDYEMWRAGHEACAKEKDAEIAKLRAEYDTLLADSKRVVAENEKLRAELAEYQGMEIVAYQAIQKNGLSEGGVYARTGEIELLPKCLYDPEIDVIRPLFAHPTKDKP